jgi:hypothetical protein
VEQQNHDIDEATQEYELRISAYMTPYYDGAQQKKVDKDKVADYMDKNTNDTDTYHHHCAAVCHAGLAAGGLGYDKGRPSNAGENGPWLMAHGAQAVGHSDKGPELWEIHAASPFGEHFDAPPTIDTALHDRP